MSATQRMKTNPKLMRPELKIVVSNSPEAPAIEPPPEQVEMPFAIVNGEPFTQMPRDLYIPPQAMEVFLEAFEGPLDLLLYLIRRQNLNILDIPLAEITRQYMKYIEVMTELQLELAGEYMVMAATLAEIKSRMLLPRPKVAEDGNEEDPRAELVRRLQEYERFKRAAEGIDSLHRLERDVWTTSAEVKDRKVVRLLPQVTLQEMLLAFKDVVVRSEMFAHHHIQRERLSVRARMGDILSTLEHSSFVEFVRLFRPEEGRMGITVTFVAILELVREGLIDIVQAEPFAPLHVRSAGANRKLHVVSGTDRPDGGQVFADDAAVEGELVLSDAAVADVSAGAENALLGGANELGFDADFDDDDEDLDDEPLEGVDDVVEPSPDELAGPAGEQALAVQGGAVADEQLLAGEQALASGEAAADKVALAVDQPDADADADGLDGTVEALTAEAPTADDVPVVSVGLPVSDEIAVGLDSSVTADMAPVGEQTAADVPVASVEPPMAGDTAVGTDSSVTAVVAADSPVVDEIEVTFESPLADAPVYEQASFEAEYPDPAVEVDEFAFDELPALVGEADQQQPAAGEQTVVKKSAGTDEPPSPGEESDE